jgi:N-acylneuraminate cytidylyltransferase
VGTNPVVKHAIQWLKAQGQEVDFACCIYATAPFLQPWYLRQGFEKLSRSNKAFAFAVTRFSFPVQRAIRINASGEVEAMYPEYIGARSQDLEEAYHDAGQFYWGRTEAFLDDVAIFSPASLPILIPESEVQDIDTMDDWRHAELKWRASQEGNTDR